MVIELIPYSVLFSRGKNFVVTPTITKIKPRKSIMYVRVHAHARKFNHDRMSENSQTTKVFPLEKNSLYGSDDLIVHCNSLAADDLM